MSSHKNSPSNGCPDTLRPPVAFRDSLFIERLVTASNFGPGPIAAEPKMCCEAFCRWVCSILSSSAILVLDIVDVAVGAALFFSPLLWRSYVTAAPATIALPSYGVCLVILSAISLFGVGFRSKPVWKSKS